MKVLVFGSGGFIGKNLVALLRQKGVDVVMASSANGTSVDAKAGTLVAGFSIPRDTDTVFYFAQSPLKAESASHVMSVNTLVAVQVAELACKSGVRRFIYTSSGNVYSPGFSPLPESTVMRRDDWYALSKAHAEEALALFGDQLDVTAARLFGVYGPGQRGRLVPNLIERVKSGSPVFLEKNPANPKDVDGLRISLCYVDDTVQILMRLAKCEGVPRINIASDEAVSIRKLATSIGELVGRAPVLEMSGKSRTGDLVADIDLLKKLLDPSFTRLETGISRTLEQAG